MVYAIIITGAQKYVERAEADRPSSFHNLTWIIIDLARDSEECMDATHTGLQND